MKPIQLVSIAIMGLASCGGPPGPDLATGLRGIDEAHFLSCSGPPTVSLGEPGQERMTFLTNGSRGQGLVSPAAAPLAACSATAVFQEGRLAEVTLGGNPDICVRVFGPCAQK